MREVGVYPLHCDLNGLGGLVVDAYANENFDSVYFEVVEHSLVDVLGAFVDELAFLDVVFIVGGVDRFFVLGKVFQDEGSDSSSREFGVHQNGYGFGRTDRTGSSTKLLFAAVPIFVFPDHIG